MKIELPCFISHKWGKWEQQTRQMIYLDTGKTFKEIYQERCCEKCGFTQTKDLMK